MGPKSIFKNSFHADNQTLKRNSFYKRPLGQESEDVKERVTKMMRLPKFAFPTMVKLMMAGATHWDGAGVGRFESHTS